MFLDATAGLVYGDSIRSTAGIANIRKNMGVCPQFDVLWESLSAREHLHVFGSLKGLSGADIGRVSFDHKSVLSFFLVSSSSCKEVLCGCCKWQLLNHGMLN
jgi:ABC-type multidrug transport system ATPase subunit